MSCLRYTTWIIKIPIEWIVFYSSFLSIKINAQLLALASFSIYPSVGVCVCVSYRHALSNVFVKCDQIHNRFFVVVGMQQTKWFCDDQDYLNFCLFLYCYYKLRFFSPSFCRLLHTPSVCFLALVLLFIFFFFLICLFF